MLILQRLPMVRAMLRNEKGQGMVEYGLILAVIAVVAVLTMTTLGTTVAAMFTTVTGKL